MVESKYEIACSSVSAFINISSDSRAFLQDLSKSSEIMGKHGIYIYVYTYIYVYVCVYTYVYIYTYIRCWYHGIGP